MYKNHTQSDLESKPCLKSDFFYNLPDELIAQSPAEPRDSSRLMVITRRSDGAVTIKHDRFYNIADYLSAPDLLVVNDSKVFPARLVGHVGNKDAELMLISPQEHHQHRNVWETMVYPGNKLRPGAAATLSEGVTAEVLQSLPNGNRLVRFACSGHDGDITPLLEQIGQIPLPHYITEPECDNLSERYNTVYAEKSGSVAAPTAGLHFTDDVFAKLAQKGVETAKVTLHVGIGTFRPVKSELVSEHKMHSEWYSVPTDTAEKLRKCREGGGRVVAVGTTSCRTLEASQGRAVPSGNTDIFITPGYKFTMTDCLITNFHLPESTLLMLISAFMGRENALEAYEAAIAERYRFYSFGDSMLIL